MKRPSLSLFGKELQVGFVGGFGNRSVDKVINVIEDEDEMEEDDDEDVQQNYASLPAKQKSGSGAFKQRLPVIAATGAGGSVSASEQDPFLKDMVNKLIEDHTHLELSFKEEQQARQKLELEVAALRERIQALENRN
jgi:hypothetical protein